MKIFRVFAVIFLLLLLFVGVIYSLNLLEASKTSENYLLFGASCLLTVVVYMTTVLDYRITGGNVGVERAKNEVYAVRKEVVEIANTLVKMSAVVADGSGRYGGFPKEHQDKVNEYIQNLRGMLSKDIDQQVHNDVEEVREKLQVRIDEKNKDA